jgi:hypothetical protein
VYIEVLAVENKFQTKERIRGNREIRGEAAIIALKNKE